MKISFGRMKSNSLAVCLILLSLTSIAFVPRARASTIFHITLLVPNSNPSRQSWSLVVQSELQSLGIDAGRVILDFNTIVSKLFPNPGQEALVGKIYDNGGWDAVFIGNALSIDPDPAILYNSTNFPPPGQNYNLWNNSRGDHFGTLIEQTNDRPTRLNYVQQWQAVAQNATPAATILYTRETVAFDSKITNGQYVFQTYHFPYWPPIEQLSTPTDASIIMDQTGGPPANLIPELSQSYYDTTVSGVIFASLAQRNDTVFKSMVPQLASGTVSAPGWSVASDGKTWTVNLRPGLMWHDGSPFTADDVKFTFDSILNDTLAAPVEGFYKGVIGNKNNVVVLNPTTVQFTLPNVYSYFIQNILGGTAILPKHILNPMLVPYASWRTNVFNTGQQTGCTSSCMGPVGLGPYKWDHYTPATQTAYLVRNDNYYDFPVNGRPELIARGAFTVKNYAVATVTGSDVAISNLQSGTVDILDSQYHLEGTQYNFLQSWPAGQEAVYDAYGIQELGFNMKHPILGTGTLTPLGQQDPTKAALAAQYVRQAISHAIPRQLIIQQLLNGYGKPGITSAVTPAMDGFNTALIPDDFNLTESRTLLQKAGYFPTSPSTPSFWDAYGVYIAGALVAAIVAISALFVFRSRRRPVSTMPTGSAPTLVPGAPPPPPP